MTKLGYAAVLTVLLSTAACAASGASEQQAARESHACAELGLTPGTAAFGSCVGNLDAALFVDEHSGHL